MTHIHILAKTSLASNSHIFLKQGHTLQELDMNYVNVYPYVASRPLWRTGPYILYIQSNSDFQYTSLFS